MKKISILIVLSLLLAIALPGHAQNQLDVGNDKFLSGPAPVHTANDIDDLFMSGDTVRSVGAISGSAHLAGRNIILEGAVGGDVYAAGMDVAIDAPIAGDATVAGYNVSIGDVGGDLRVSAKKLSLSGQIDGYTLIRGDQVRFECSVKGDVSLTARQVVFTESAQIDGKLTVYEDKVGETEIPESVIPADRIERRPAPGSDEAIEDLAVWDRGHPVMQFLTRLLFVGIIVGLLAVLIPETTQKLREVTFRRPFATFWLGFLALSAAIGSAIVLMITGIAFILVPISLLIAFVGALAGYFAGVYLVGSGVLTLIGREEGDGRARRALAAATGALAATLISRIPVLGWVGTFAIVLIGVGALAVWMFRPKFFATA